MTKQQQIQRDVKIISERSGLNLSYTAHAGGYRLECEGREIGPRMSIGKFVDALDMCEQLLYWSQKNG